MKQFIRPLTFICLSGLLVACKLFAPAPAATPTPLPTHTPTAVPTLTDTATATVIVTPTPANTATYTPVPTVETPKPTESVDMPTPAGTPVGAWQEIPIMPEALSGEDTGDGYSFLIEATPQEVWEYYDAQLKSLGWSTFASGTNEDGTPALLFYTKGTQTLTLSIVPQEQSGLTQVILIMLPS